MPAYQVGEPVIVHTRDGRERDNGEWPGKVVSMARVKITIEWSWDGSRPRTDVFRMDTKHIGDYRGTNYGPWFETPAEQHIRLAVADALVVLAAHGLEPVRRERARDEVVLAVARLLRERFGADSDQLAG